jgi:serine/threonine protein kinase
MSVFIPFPDFDPTNNKMNKNPNQIVIDGKVYTKQTSCDDIELIQYLKKNNKINPNLENKEYAIQCKNNNIYDVEQKPTGEGSFNSVYELLGEHNDKIIRVTKVNSNNDKLTDEIQGLFLQYYISKNCRYICKVYEFGYLKSGNETRVYAILEKLIEPDIFGINFEGKKPKHEYNYKIIMQQVLEGLKCMNNNNFVHLDIKLENIGIGIDKNARIFDFGFARYINTNPMSTGGNIFGTELYVDPEILYFNKVYLNSDIYSVGNMLNNLYISSKYYGFDRSFNMQYLMLPKDNGLPEKYINLFNTINNNKDIEKKVILKNRNKLVYRKPIELIDEKYFTRYRIDDYKTIISKYQGNQKEINDYIEKDTKNLIDLIKGMMRYDATKRYSVNDVLNNEWFDNIKENENVSNIISPSKTIMRSNSILNKDFLSQKRKKSRSYLNNVQSKKMRSNSKSASTKKNIGGKESK